MPVQTGYSEEAGPGRTCVLIPCDDYKLKLPRFQYNYYPGLFAEVCVYILRIYLAADE